MIRTIPARSHVDTLGFLGDVAPPVFDPETLKNARKSGVTLFHLTTAMPFGDWQATLDRHDRVMQALEAHRDTFSVVRSASDLPLLHTSGKIGVIPGIQDPEFIGDRLERLHDLFDHGIRIMQVAYQRTNPYGTGFLAEYQDHGLTPLGRDFVKEVRKTGMILDLSHLSPHTALDCLEITQGPVMISHTTARGVCPHRRGSRDDVLRGLLHQEDTLVGVLAMTFFLHRSDDSLSTLARHIRHVADMVGPDKVAVGSDGPIGGFTDLTSAEKTFRETMQGLMDPHGLLGSRWPTHVPDFAHRIDGFRRLARALEGLFTPDEIDGILGDNGYRWFSRALPGGVVQTPSQAS